MHKSYSGKMAIEIAPVDILHDVFQPMTPLLYTRGMDVEVQIECPSNLVVRSDCLRLQQIVLNLARNSLKFVQQKGFIRLRAATDSNNNVCLYIEDSGPGIPLRKRNKLFTKFQESLDSLNQGTGIGLCLCKNLIELMGGKIWLDDAYHSGVEGCPGARFVLDLKTTPLSVEAITPTCETQQSSGTMLVSESSTSTTDCDQREDPFALDEGVPQKQSQQKLPAELKVLFVDDNMVLR